MRVHSIARSYNVQSKDVIYMHNLVRPKAKPLRSASSAIVVDENNRVFWHSLMSTCQARRDAR